MESRFGCDESALHDSFSRSALRGYASDESTLNNSYSCRAGTLKYSPSWESTASGTLEIQMGASGPRLMIVKSNSLLDREEKALPPLPVRVVSPTAPIYIKGTRYRMILLGISICQFLVNIEVSIVATSLPAIANDLNGFRQQGWVVTAYLVTYGSLMVIWSKLSSLFGRKPGVLLALSIFTIFSGACGGARSIVELIVSRALQGIGAAGTMSIAFILLFELVPMSEWAATVSKIGLTSAMGSLLGPIMGGGISGNSAWRWVFLFNVPVGILTLLLLYISLPNNFPNHARPDYVAPSWSEQFSRRNIARIDFIGAFLLTAWSLFLVTVLLEAGIDFPWASSTAITLLVLAFVFCFFFLAYEKAITADEPTSDGQSPKPTKQTRTPRPQEPIFPWRFITNRKLMGTLLVSFLMGVPYSTLMIAIPQKLQTVYGISPLGAGIRLLPFNLLIAFGYIGTNVFAAATGCSPIWILLAGSTIQLVGLVLFSTVPTDLGLGVPMETYEYQIISGFGVGIVMGILLTLPPRVIDPKDMAIASGSLLQFRVLGGAFGLSVASAVMNGSLTSNLKGLLSSAELSGLLETTSKLADFPEAIQKKVLDTFLTGFNLQMRIMAGFAGLQIVLVFMLWQKPQVSMRTEPQAQAQAPPQQTAEQSAD